MAVERQSGSDDCGLFALAYAVTLLTGFDPVNVVYEQPRICLLYTSDAADE